MAERVVSVRLSAKVAGYVRGMKDAARETYKADSAAEKLQMRRDAIRDLGVVATGVGVAMTGMAVAATKAAIDWETAWTGVEKVIDGTPEQLVAIEDSLRAMSREVPSSHAEIAAVAEAAGRLGIESESIAEFTRTMIDMGEATNIEAEEAATTLARLMNVMGTSPDDVDRLGSAIVDLGNNFATSESEITAMSGRLAGAGAQIGLTEGDVVGLAAALSAVGIEAEAGGSAMSKVMIDMASSVEEGGERLGMFAEVSGLTAEQFAAQWESEPGEALAAFVEGLAAAESQGESAIGILSDFGITEVRMRDALLRSASAADDFSRAMSVGNEAFEENNALAEEAARRYETVESQLKIAGNAITDAGISLGSVFMPAVAGAAEGMAEFAGWFADLPEGVQGTISVLGLASGVVAGVGGLALLAVPKLVEYSTTLDAIGLNGQKMRGRMGGVLRFLTGPWALGIGAAVLGVQGLKGIIDDVGASSAEMQSTLKVAESAESAWSRLAEGKRALTVRDMSEDLDIFGERLDQSADKWSNWRTRASLTIDPTASEVDQFNALVGELGEEISAVAATDMPEAQRQFSLFADETEGTHKQLWALLSLMPDYKDQVITAATEQGVLTEDMSESERQAALLEVAMSNTADETERGGEVAKSAADRYLEESSAIDEVRSSLDQLLDKLGEANDANSSAITASADYEAALDSVTEQIEKIAAGEEGYAAGLDLATEAGRANVKLLQDQASTAQDTAEAQFELDGSVEDYVQRLKDGREQFIQNAQDMGATKDEAKDLADQIFAIPSEKEIRVLAETKEAEEELKRLERERIAHIKAKVSVDWADDGESGEMMGGREVFANADGGLYDYGPGIYSGTGDLYKFAEPETGWEAFISGKSSERDRNVGVWQQAGERLGMFGGGGSGQTVTVNQSFNMPPGVTPQQVEQISGRGVQKALR